MTARKLSAAIIGFVAGVVTWPLVAVVWPFVVVWFLWNEEDDV